MISIVMRHPLSNGGYGKPTFFKKSRLLGRQFPRGRAVLCPCRHPWHIQASALPRPASQLFNKIDLNVNSACSDVSHDLFHLISFAVFSVLHSELIILFIFHNTCVIYFGDSGVRVRFRESDFVNRLRNNIK
ncbi:PREDICTED: uncharacterized protein LOC105151466 isoform X2 [Acromyrmex echinatior]|uniref:uncharacterized protein LOC105151466 isoform X2 n=1 Tax=Acromyrmex echinatior TaxID=103372 RepID=UPI000580B9A3|nr:PREDICTED: uncharacterized protein LOC105151466 isoform X2 [Acromyrmex echinatior]